MRINQDYIPQNQVVHDNDFYLPLNNYFLNLLKKTPQYSKDNERIEKGMFDYELSDSEKEFYSKYYFLLSKTIPTNDAYPLITQVFDIEQLPENSISEREYDIIQLIFGDIESDIAVIQGNVGWGKSTLLTYVITYLLRFRKERKIIPLYFNFNLKVNKLNACKDKNTAVEIFYNEYLQKKILKIVGDELQIDNEDLWSYFNSLEHFAEYRTLETNILKLTENQHSKLQELRLVWLHKRPTVLYAFKYYLQKYNSKAILVLDNLDPINDFCSKGIFIEVYKICNDIGIKAIISFRPNTYNEILNKKEGIYDTISPKKVQLLPPEAETIFSNSTAILEKDVRNKKAIIQVAGITLETDDTYSLLETFITLLGNKSITELLNSISQGNLRNWAHLMRTYFKSGYLNSHRLLEAYLNQEVIIGDDSNEEEENEEEKKLKDHIEKRTEYNPEWIAYSAIITSNYNTYFPSNQVPVEKDYVINLFNNKTWSINPILIRLHILHFLNRSASDLKFLVSTYCALFAEDVEMSSKSVKYATRIMINAGLIKSNKIYKVDSDSEMELIEDISINESTGRFYILQLISNFEYLNFMKDDTELDELTYSKIIGCINSNWQGERYVDNFHFINYLFQQEKLILKNFSEVNRNKFMKWFSPSYDMPFYSYRICKEMIKYGLNRSKLGISNNQVDLFRNLQEKIVEDSKKYLK